MPTDRAVYESKELGVWGSFGRVPGATVVSSRISDYLYGCGPCFVFTMLQPSSERSRTVLDHVCGESVGI